LGQIAQELGIARQAVNQWHESPGACPGPVQRLSSSHVQAIAAAPVLGWRWLPRWLLEAGEVGSGDDVEGEPRG
jgi:hypothetical protein